MALKKLKVDEQIVDNDLRNCPNQVVKSVNTVILAAANQMKNRWQRKTIKLFGQLGLWIVYKDTAYRDAFFWIMYQILIRADKLLKVIEPYVKEPCDWTPNLWYDSRKLTKEQKKKGEIPDYSKSMEETIFTPSIQDKRHKKILQGGK